MIQEWPDEAYPTYANGAGYIISTNISRFVVSERRQRTLEVFSLKVVVSESFHWGRINHCHDIIALHAFCSSYSKWRMLAWDYGSINFG